MSKRPDKNKTSVENPGRQGEYGERESKQRTLNMGMSRTE